MKIELKEGGKKSRPLGRLPRPAGGLEEVKKKKPKHYDKHSKLPWYLRPDTVVWGRRELKTRYITESEFCTLKDGGKKCAEKLH